MIVCFRNVNILFLLTNLFYIVKLYNKKVNHLSRGNMRKEYEMTQDEMKKLLEACKPTPMIMLQCGNPPTQQETANGAWQELAKEKGFIWDTVEPVSGKSNLFFTAETSI